MIQREETTALALPESEVYQSMNARKKLTVAQQKVLKDAVARETKEYTEKMCRISAYKVMLFSLYTLRFDFNFKQRLHKYFDAMISHNDYIENLMGDDVAVEILLKQLEDSGCHFNGAFDELLEYEREVYKKHCEKEQAIRKARAK